MNVMLGAAVLVHVYAFALAASTRTPSGRTSLGLMGTLTSTYREFSLYEIPGASARHGPIAQ